MIVPRGIRNNNPGNLRITSDKWVGLIPGEDLSFYTFRDAKFGIRAMAKVLITYGKRYKLHTIEGIISRWAPPSENNTEAYIDILCSRLGCDSSSYVDTQRFGTLELFTRAIIKHENGQQPYDEEVILVSISAALK